MQKIGLFFTGLMLAGASSSFGQAVLDNTPAKVTTELNSVADSAIELFDVVVPVIIAVVALGILITFAKKVKKS